MPDLPLVGDEFAGYRLRSVLGRGGMSTVYLAENPRLGNVIALKILAPELAVDDIFRTRFLEESRIAAGMNHPHVIPIHDMGSSDGLLYIAMRAVSGTDLRQMIKKRGRLQPDTAIFLLGQAARALDAAHRRGLVHRDVKPGNLLVERGSEDGEPDHVYLTDFGISKTATGRTGLTNTGQFLGTIDYVAPEQIRGISVLGMADQYSLGCVLYECLTGRVPFEKDLDAAIIWAHVEEFPTQPTLIRPDLPPPVDEVFSRVLAKNPGDRYESCREFITAARDALGPMADVPGTAGTGSGVRSAWPDSAPTSYPEIAHDVPATVRDATMSMAVPVVPAAPPEEGYTAPPQPGVPQPAGSQLAGSQPTRVEPTGSQPTRVEPTGSQPTRVEPTGSQPGLPGPGEVRYLGGPQYSGPAPYPLSGVPTTGGLTGGTPPGGGGVPDGSPGRRRWLIAVAALALIAAGVGGAWAAVSSGGSPHPQAVGGSRASAAASMPATASMSASASGTAKSGELMQAIVQAAQFTKHLRVSSCKQQGPAVVTCGNPDPTLSIGPVTFQVFPSRAALYAAYRTDASKLQPGFKENNLGGCDGRPSVVGEAAWSHNREFFTSYSISEMIAGKVGPAAGRVFCTNNNGVEYFVWTQNQGNMLAYTDSLNHDDLWTWWVAVHHYIGVGGPPDMGGMVMPSASPSAPMPSASASGSAMPSGTPMSSATPMPSGTAMTSSTAMP